MSHSIYWLIASALFFTLEALGIPGIGFLFAAIAAAFVGILVEMALLAPSDILSQLAVFLLATGLTALLLWKRLKGWRLNPNAPHYSNIVGTEATVTRALIGDAEGEVRWSGTLMRATLVDTQLAPVANGSVVVVRALKGNLLLVAPK